MAQPHSPVSELPTELLDLTLQYLSFEELLGAIRVCQRWRQICFRSHTVQKWLFLMPEEVNVGCKYTESYEGWSARGEHLEIVSLLHSYASVSPWPRPNIDFANRRSYPTFPALTYMESVRALGNLNTLFFRSPRDCSITADMFRTPYTFLKPIRSINKDIPAEYRKMLLCQPPFQEVQYQFYLMPTRNAHHHLRPREGDGAVLKWHDGFVRNVSGVTVQDLMDVVARLEVEDKSFIEWDIARLWGMHILCPTAKDWSRINGDRDGVNWDFDPQEYVKRFTQGIT